MNWNSSKLISMRYKTSMLISSQLFWIIVCAVGIWVIAIQGFIHEDGGAQKVYVVGGDIDAKIDNTVDINVESVNGYRNAFYGPSADGSYDAIHVYTGK